MAKAAGKKTAAAAAKEAKAALKRRLARLELQRERAREDAKRRFALTVYREVRGAWRKFGGGHPALKPVMYLDGFLRMVMRVSGCQCGWDCHTNREPGVTGVPNPMNTPYVVRAHCAQCPHPGAASSIWVLDGMEAEGRALRASPPVAMRTRSNEEED